MVSEVLESLFSPCRDCEVDFVSSMVWHTHAGAEKEV